MSLPTWVGLASGDEKETSSAAKERSLGTIGWTEVGGKYRWAKNSSVALAGGVLVQGPAANSSQDAALDISGGAAGATELGVVVQATVTRDQYKDGWVTVDTGPGVAKYKIKSHAAASSGATLTIALAPNDPVVGAMSSGTTKVGLRENPYKNVIVAPTTVTGPLLGITQCSVAASHYFWVQESDFGIWDTDVAPAVNTSLIFGGTSAGKGNARSSALNDIPEITIAESVDAGAGADKANFVRIKLA
jgi:hypothetical protein